MKEILIRLYSYNYWATARILNSAASLSEAQFTAPGPFSHATLRGTLVHTLSAEWIWRARCQEGISPRMMLSEDDFPTLASIVERWQVEEQKMRAYLASLTTNDLEQTIHYKQISGQTTGNELAHILHQVILHGVQHRAEMAAILTGFGHSPGDIDFIIYLRNQ